MSCSAYEDQRLATIYDPLNASDTDLRFFEGIVGPPPRTVLDVGSGTGRFASRLAGLGHRVTGLEPAAGMMAIARRRDKRVDWIDGTAEMLDSEKRFEFATMTGHVFQVFRDDEHTHTVLTAVRRHLTPGGRLAFDSRNPVVCAWEDWGRRQTVRTVQAPDLGPVEVYYDLVEHRDEHVTFETHFRFSDGSQATATDTLRFASRETIATALSSAGFGTVEWFGGHDGSPWTPASPEIVVVAQG